MQEETKKERIEAIDSDTFEALYHGGIILYERTTFNSNRGLARASNAVSHYSRSRNSESHVSTPPAWMYAILGGS